MKNKKNIILITFLGLLFIVGGIISLFFLPEKSVDTPPEETPSNGNELDKSLTEELLQYQNKKEYMILLDMELDYETGVSYSYRFDYHDPNIYLVDGELRKGEELEEINGYVNYELDVWTQEFEDRKETWKVELAHPHDILELIQSGEITEDGIKISKDKLNSYLYFTNLYPFFDGARRNVLVKEDPILKISKEDSIKVEGTFTFENGLHLEISYRFYEAQNK